MNKKVSVNNKINVNINVLKVMAILIIVYYHIYDVFGLIYGHNIINSLLYFGGLVGVTLFFMLSGYCIYLYLDNHKDMNYFDFIISRWKKLSPDYYFSLFITFIFTEFIFYFSYAGLINLFSHLLYIHNLSINFAGAFNGVCWTLGTIFQFYLIAPFMKKLIDKRPYLSLIIAYLIDIVVKYLLFMLLFRYCLDGAEINKYYFVTYGSQIYSSVGIFAIGMFLAKKINNMPKTNSIFNYLCFIISLIILAFYLYALGGNLPFFQAPDYSSNLKSVIMHDALSLILALNILFFNRIKLPLIVDKITSVLIKYEYSIYIWHLLILTNIARSFDFVERFNIHSSLFASLVLMFISISLSVIMGFLVKCIINGYKATANNLPKIDLKKIGKAIIIIFIIYIVYICSALIPITADDIKNYKNNLECDGSCRVYESSIKKMDCGNKTCKYVYLDNEATGYLYYHQLRGYFSPYILNQTLVMDSIAKVNARDEQYLIDYLLRMNPDYVIARDSKILSDNGYELDLENGKVYKINKNFKNLSDLLEEVK